MVFSKKICVYTFFLGSIFCFNLRAEEKAPLEIAASVVKNDWHVNLITRVTAKTAMEYTAEAIKNSAADQIICCPSDISKAIGSAALDELAPLPKSAQFAIKHADLLLPIIFANLLAKIDKANEGKLLKIDKEVAIKLLKKELFKGFFINPDFNKLETLEDAAFFAADFGAEVALKNKDIETDYFDGFKRALSSKIISPIIMAYAGNEVVLAFAKTENKNIQKQLCILFEKLVVGNILNAALKIKE